MKSQLCEHTLVRELARSLGSDIRDVVKGLPLRSTLAVIACSAVQLNSTIEAAAAALASLAPPIADAQAKGDVAAEGDGRRTFASGNRSISSSWTMTIIYGRTRDILSRSVISLQMRHSDVSLSSTAGRTGSGPGFLCRPVAAAGVRVRRRARRRSRRSHADTHQPCAVRAYGLPGRPKSHKHSSCIISVMHEGGGRPMPCPHLVRLRRS